MSPYPNLQLNPVQHSVAGAREMTDYEKARAWDALQNNFLAIEIEESNIKKAFNRKDTLEKKQRQLLRTGRAVEAEACGLCGMEVCNCDSVSR